MCPQERLEGTIMKVTIQNLGVIRHAEFDLKPLTILIGPNNAGKTWMAYTLAGIFGSHGWREYAEAYAEGKLSEKYPPLDEAIEKVLKSGSAKIDLSKFAEQYGEQYFQNVADYARRWIPDFMGTQFAVFDRMKVSINTFLPKEIFWEHIKNFAMNFAIAGESLKINKKQFDSVIYMYTLTENNEAITEKIPAEEIRRRLVYSFTQGLHQSLYSQVIVFPTERTDLITFQFSTERTDLITFQSNRIAEKLALLDEKMREIFEETLKILQRLQDMTKIDFREVFSQELSKKAIGPVGYFLGTLTSIFTIDSKEISQREKAAENNPEIQKYIQLAQTLENQILNGGLAFSTPEPEPQRDILFSPTQGTSLEIPIASSMVKELTPLVLYLRHLAQPNELLVIDEPEMNLHPEAQAQMIEFLAMLVRAGLHVLVTTHSSYMVDHLVNLIQAAEHEQEEQKALADIFFLQNAEAFISQNDVSVYLIDQGKAENILHDGKINWSTFGDVSDRIAQIHFAV